MCSRFRFLAISMFVILGLYPAMAAETLDEVELAKRLQAGGHVLLMRHALAPGTGDPTGFTLGDCKTQRNLDDVGRAQARAMGAWLRAHGVTSARVYSGQWCRAKETAKLLDLGPVSELPVLNVIFDNQLDRAARISAMWRFLTSLPRDGGPVVLVTHVATIRAFFDEQTSSGQGLILKLDESINGATPVGRMRMGAHSPG
jgi:phosphohistidine phosphatase SixA